MLGTKLHLLGGLVVAMWLFALGCAMPPAATNASTAPLTEEQMRAIDRLTGANGTHHADEDVYKVTFPRTDVPVTVDGWKFQPFMGITSWAAFTPAGHGNVMVMGDLTLFEDEVNSAMSELLDNGLSVTALHNHFFYDQPKVMFMHIGGTGPVDQLAAGVRKALDKVAEIREASPQPASQFPGEPIPEESSITPSIIDGILGVRGAARDGMYKVVIGRTASMDGRDLGKQMGVNTWAAFAGSDDNAFVDGDFAMRESEVQGVLKALRAAGINVVAIHNHMIQDEPRYVFLHYWGKGTTADLANGLKSGLAALGV